MTDEPLDSLSEFRKTVREILKEHLGCEQRRQSDYGTYPKDLVAAGRAQDVIVKFVLFVPKPRFARSAGGVYRLGDINEMFKEFRREILENMVRFRQFESNPHHVESGGRNPGSAIRLVKIGAARQILPKVERTNIIEAEKAALKYIPTIPILTIYPPSEVQHQLVEDALKEGDVSGSFQLTVDLIGPQRGPGHDWRISVAEAPFVGGDLAIGMQRARLREQHELRLGEVGIDQCENHALEAEIPRGEPRIFPFVRHRNDIAEKLPGVA